MTISECAGGIGKTGQKVIFAYHKELEVFDVLFVSPKTNAMVVKMRGIKCFEQYLPPFMPGYYLTPIDAWKGRIDVLKSNVAEWSEELEMVRKETECLAPKEPPKKAPVQLSLF